jgi:uncharacterized protein (UPF0335 family)
MTDSLKNYIDALVSLKDEHRAILNEIKAIYDNAKKDGFDPKIIKQILKIMENPQKTAHDQEILEEYLKELNIVL